MISEPVDGSTKESVVEISNVSVEDDDVSKEDEEDEECVVCEDDLSPTPNPANETAKDSDTSTPGTGW